MAGGAKRAWRRLVEPHPTLTEVGDRLRAEWLAGLVLVFAALALTSAVVQLAFVPGFAARALAIAVASAMLLVAYAFARSPRYRIGGWLAAMVPMFVSPVVALTAPEDSVWFGFLLMSTLIASIFVSTFAAAIVTALGLVSVFVSYNLEPRIGDYTPLFEVVALLSIVAPLIVIAAYHRNKIERERERALRESLLELREARRLEMVGRLAGGIAHDFNNLLTVMYVNLDLIARERSEDAHLAEIRHVADRAASLTRQLLAFARKQVLEPVVLDTNAAIGEAEALLRRLVGENIDLVVVPNPHVGRIKADPAQLEQIVVNLALNARDAMPDGGRLTIELADADVDAGARPGHYVVLSVTDSGEGMDEETRDRVFEPFFTTKGVNGGTGLGLATVHGIAAQSGGHVTVDSEPGKGTCFKVYLPRASEPVADANDPRREASPQAPGAMVLVVEDNETLRRSMAVALRDAGYRVLTAASGHEALEVIAERGDEIDVVLSDVVMPGMSGREVADHVAASHSALKVLLVSGYADDLVQPRREGYAFLAKPFTAQALAEKVAELVRG